MPSDRPEEENAPLLDGQKNSPLLDGQESDPLFEGQTQTRCCSFRVYGPDGVWSWLVAFANFLVNFIIVGLGRMSGILYIEFMHDFNIDRSTASIPLSVQQAGRNLFGPLAGILGQKYGMRAVTILGGIIGALSAAIIYFKMDVTSITILWGLFFGMSTALTTTLNQISIDQYFERHRATAGGFAFSGGCIGAFFFPVVINTLISHYGLRGMFLVLGAIILFVLPAAMFLVEPPWKQEQNTISRKSTFSSYGAIDAAGPSSLDNSFETETANRRIAEAENEILLTDIDFRILQESSDTVLRFFNMDISDTNIRPLILHEKHLLNELECIYASFTNPEYKSFENISPDKLSVNSETNDSELISKFQPKDCNNEDVGNESSAENVYIQTRLRELHGANGLQLVSHFTYLDQKRAWKVLLELRKMYEYLNGKRYILTSYKSSHCLGSLKRKVSDTLSTEQSNENRPNTFCSHIMTAIKLHANPLFLMICLCRGVFMLTFIPVVTIIVDFAMDKGLPKSDGSYVIAILSLGDLIGRLCLGWVTDRGFLSLPRYMLVVMVILGGSAASLPQMTTRASFMAAVLIFGILQGSLFVRHPLLVSLYMEKHEQSIGMGFINFLSGFLGFALPAFIGFFRDKLGSYDKMFYLNGIICVVVGLMWLLEPCLLSLVTTYNNRRRAGRTNTSASLAVSP